MRLNQSSSRASLSLRSMTSLKVSAILHSFPSHSTGSRTEEIPFFSAVSATGAASRRARRRTIRPRHGRSCPSERLARRHCSRLARPPFGGRAPPIGSPGSARLRATFNRLASAFGPLLAVRRARPAPQASPKRLPAVPFEPSERGRVYHPRRTGEKRPNERTGQSSQHPRRRRPART